MDKRPTIHGSREPDQAADRCYRRASRRSWRPGVGVPPRRSSRPGSRSRTAHGGACLGGRPTCVCSRRWRRPLPCGRPTFGAPQLKVVDDPILGHGIRRARAWGYTDMVHEHIVAHPALCAGALAVSDPGFRSGSAPSGRSSWCTRHTTYATGRRGAARPRSNAKRSAISPSVLNCSARHPSSRTSCFRSRSPRHQRMVTRFREYRDRGKLPLWRLPMTP